MKQKLRPLEVFMNLLFFVCGLIAIFVVSLLTAAPSKEITDEFDSYRSCEE